ncbi:MAG: hypothetical protein JSS75_07990 [Bacteroidetes bacterium]|nr:hypothetical protein [Bacteroidota bacterium]
MIDKLKDILATVREAILIVAFLLLLVFPSCFNQILVNAGFTEGSVMGFTWKQQATDAQQLADSSQRIAQTAADQLENTKAALEIAMKKLESIPAAATSPEVAQMKTTLDSTNKVLNPAGKTSLKSAVLNQRLHLDQLKMRMPGK